MSEREELIEDILAVEWEMFQRVKSAAPAPCQSSPDAFKKIRGSIFEMWPVEILESYLEHLRTAHKDGRNLLTEKYARMDNLIPPLSKNHLIEKIVEIETEWQKEISDRYPAIYDRMCRGTNLSTDGSNFSIYLRSELETYGDQTIELYYAHVSESYKRGENIAILALRRLIEKAGYHDLNHAESHLKRSDS